MANIHLTLQGKGGVGKSFISTLNAQYLNSKNKADTKTLCFDADPVNKTFSGFKKLNVEDFGIIKDGLVVPRKFDELMEILLTTETDVVVDNGSTSFLPLVSYLDENNAVPMLKESGKTVFIHTLITGGQAIMDSFKGLQYLVDNFKDSANIVVWKNHYFGEIKLQGKEFEDMKIYKDNKSVIHGVVDIPDFNATTYGQDIQDMLQQHLTFDEAINSEKFSLMSKQRLKLLKKQTFENISSIY